MSVDEDLNVAAAAAHAPEWMQANETSLADGARKHVEEVQRSHNKWFWKSWNCMKGNDEDDSDTEAEEEGDASRGDQVQPGSIGPASIQFGDGRKEQRGQDRQTDLFKWVALYENQRGITMFSTAYYSSRSLLPFDPPPFAIPDPGESIPHIYHGHRTPNVTLDTYSLPDPTWRWVSKSWLVDMRRSGDVAHDGFEYAWHFGGRHWRPQVGWFSAGGWVRRRLWVRLMMRPSEARLAAEAAMAEAAVGEDIDDSPSKQEQGPIWRGDDGDWERMRKVLIHLGQDGPRLDLWVDWLSDLRGHVSKPHARHWTEDEFTRDRFEIPVAELVSKHGLGVERPKREWIDALLREHGLELAKCFVYPDSRAQLREFLIEAGLAEDAASLGRNDFWDK